jgi:putative ABC transport system substrate-binding protein
VIHITLSELKRYGNLGNVWAFADQRGGDLFMIRRRDLIAALGGAAASLPLRSVAVCAQQPARTKRIGILMGRSESDPEARSYIAAFVQDLARRGWSIGSNVRIEQRWTDANIGRARTFARELVALRPDVLLGLTTPATAALLSETRTLPIVFVGVSDPVGEGFAASLSHPGGNATGFINMESTMSGKMLGLLKEIAPRIRRAAIMFNPETAPGGGSYFLGPFEGAGQSLGIDTVINQVRSDSEIEAAIAVLGREQAGLVPMSDSFVAVRSRIIASLCARHHVPAIFGAAVSFAKDGGLMGYGATYPDQFRRAAGYVDRILRGENPADLPVEQPTKFELVINLRTAKALGLAVPPNLLALADEVIE